jgi:hypothetical protein
MNPQDEPQKPIVLMPPRPNPGPEAWQEPMNWAPPAAAGVGLVVLLLLIVRRRRRKRRPAAIPSVKPQSVAEPIAPSEGLLGHAIAIRTRLAQTFGDPWLAMTTEEITENPLLRARLDESLASEVVALLQAADRIKFDAHADVSDLACDGVWRRLDAALVGLK